MPRRLAYHNRGEITDVSPEVPTDVARREFGKRLQAAMVNKGWNQSELARRAAAFTTTGVFGRDNVSCYIRGITLPGPSHLAALAKALGVEAETLLPTRGIPTVVDKSPPLDVRDLGNGRAWLRINQEVPWADALKIMQIVRG